MIEEGTHICTNIWLSCSDHHSYGDTPCNNCLSISTVGEMSSVQRFVFHEELPNQEIGKEITWSIVAKGIETSVIYRSDHKLMRVLNTDKVIILKR